MPYEVAAAVRTTSVDGAREFMPWALPGHSARDAGVIAR